MPEERVELSRPVRNTGFLAFSTLRDSYSDADKGRLLSLASRGYRVIALTREEPYDLFDRFEGTPHKYAVGLRELAENMMHLAEERHRTSVQRRAFIIADYKIALNAGWSNEILAEELPALGSLGFDLGITGFSDEEPAEILESVNGPAILEEPPVPDPPMVPVPRRASSRRERLKHSSDATSLKRRSLTRMAPKVGPELTQATL